MVLLYDRILRHRQISVNKSDTTWNWSFNTPCKSLKGILVLYEEEKSYVRDTSKFYNPKIQKVSVIIEGKPIQLYSQGMRSFEQYGKAHQYFAEWRLANDAQKQSQLYDVSLGEYLVNKYALWLDFRMIDENELHGTGRRIENASEGITLQIEKKEETSAGTLNEFVQANDHFMTFSNLLVLSISSQSSIHNFSFAPISKFISLSLYTPLFSAIFLPILSNTSIGPFNPILPGLLNTLQTRGAYFTHLLIRLFFILEA